jgi:hypothetical protein
MRLRQQHFRRKIATIVVWMVRAILKAGKAGHDALIGSTVLWKSNRVLEIDYIVPNWEY